MLSGKLPPAGTTPYIIFFLTSFCQQVTFGEFNNVPLSAVGFVDGNYTRVATDEELKLDFYTYMDDPRVAIGVDRHGNVAGIRVNVSTFNLITNNPGFPPILD